MGGSSRVLAGAVGRDRVPLACKTGRFGIYEGPNKRRSCVAPWGRQRKYHMANMQKPSAEQIWRTVAAITATDPFRKSDRMTGLLTYLVTQVIEQPDTRITAEAIAAALFNRTDDFNAVDDPIVRTTVSRLRAALLAYFADDTRTDDVEIRIAKGSYTPEFVHRGGKRSEYAREPGGPAKDEHRPVFSRASALIGLGAIGGVLALLALGAWLTMGRTRDEAGYMPRIFVQPIKVLAAAGDAQALAAEAGDVLVATLSNVGGAAIVDSDRNRPSPGEGAMSSDYELQTTLREGAGDLTVSWRLVDPETGIVLWAASQTAAKNGAGTPQQVASLVASKVLGLDGAVPILQSRVVNSNELTRCFSNARRILFVYGEETQQQTVDCLDRTLSSSPNFADGWAMLAYSNYRLSTYAVSKGEDPVPYIAKATAAAARARELAPQNFLTQEALAYIAFSTGDVATFKSIASTLLQRYPGDPDIKVRFGLRLATVGEEEEGRNLVKEGIAAGAASSAAAYMSLAFSAYTEGRDREVIELLEKGRQGSDYLYEVLKTAAYGQLGDAENARTARDELLKTRPNYARDFPKDAANRRASPQLTERLADGLRKAGLEIQ